MDKPAETTNQKRLRIRKSGIRAINQGTRYDVPGGLRRLARQIERGEKGRVTDALVLMRRPASEGTSQHFYKCYGTSSADELLAMVVCAEKEFLK